MPSSRELLIKLIRFALLQGYAERDGTQAPEPISLSAEEISLLGEVYKLGEKHDILPLAAKALDYIELPDVAKEAKAAFDKQKFLAVYRSNLLICEQEQLRRVLNEAGIDFVLLKGAHLRALYPEAWQRTSSDIDVLVHKEDHDNVIKLLSKELAYEFRYTSTHDALLFAPSGIHLELHFMLVENLKNTETLNMLRDVWNNAKKKSDNDFEYVLTDEMFYFYHLAHMAKHVSNGGCGIRSFIDLYLLNTRVDYDADKRNSITERGGIVKFARSVEKLAFAWFGEADYDEMSLILEDYIFLGGAYGTIKNNVAIEIGKKGGRWKYMLSRIFIPSKDIWIRYPISKKFKILTPFMQVRRWFSLLGKKSRRAVSDKICEALNYDKEKDYYVNKLLSELDI